MEHILVRRLTIISVIISTTVIGCNNWQGLGVSKQKAPIDTTKVYIDARTTLYQAAEDPDPRVRTTALEALANTEGTEAGAVMLQALRDPYAPVRFAAAMAIGDTRYAPARPILLKMIKDPSLPKKLKCAIIYALHCLGDDTYTTELGHLLRDKDKWVRAQAATIMGKMGEPSAIGPLKSIQRTDRDPVIQLEVTEALAILGDKRSIRLLEAFTKSQNLEDRLIAAQALGKTSSLSPAPILKQLLNDTRQEPVVRVAAAASLARLGQSVRTHLLLEAATNPAKVLRKARGKDAELRPIDIISLQTVAIRALQYIHEPETIRVLTPLLRSPKGAVRVAASETLLKLLQASKPTLISKEPIIKRRLPAHPTTRPTLHTAGPKD